MNLISGGLGFIGTPLTRRLLERGERVRVLDNVHPQVHRDRRAVAALPRDVEFIEGDVRDAATWQRALEGVDAVYHLAAETGTGQSLDAAARYASVNVVGTAALADALAGAHVERIFLASSRAIYGEGPYRCVRHGVVLPPPRSPAALARGTFRVACPACGEAVVPLASDALTEPRPASIYATTKLAQEHLLRQACAARGVELRVGRFQNVYGAGQSLDNSYTGVLVIFARQIDEGRTLDIYEDGAVVRDFVHVDDVVDAVLRLAALRDDPGPVDIGSGEATTQLDVVAAFARAFGRDVPFEITGHFRPGDIRHARADIGVARAVLDWRPRTAFADGLLQLVAWTRSELACRA